MSKNDFKIFNFIVICIVLLGIVAGLEELEIVIKRPVKKVEPVPPPQLSYTPQFVLISFDGSKSVDLWKDLREFKVALKDEGKNIKYTFFINTAYFLTKDTRSMYLPPRAAPGHTNIGIADGVEDIRARIHEVNAAIAGGDEIAPHTTGHHSGLGWSKEEWQIEMNSFDTILFGLDKMYPNDNLPHLNLSPRDIVGFRAPYLDTSAGLFEMLYENPRYRYDSSEIGQGNTWPTKDPHGLWRIPLGMIRLENGTKLTLAMDYNIYVHDSLANDRIKKDNPEWKRLHDDTLAAWLEYFTKNYKTNRAPVLMGYHFGQWNDKLYWEVMKEFAREVCGKPEVVCGTFKELVDYMDEYGVPHQK